MSVVARNSPCPCGSNRRYKDCHGAIAESRSPLDPPAQAAPSATPPPRRSSYRAEGKDWVDLSETEQDDCGALMERALAYQLKEHLNDAVEAYGEVLRRAPNTHDALHMLGALKLRSGDLAEAKQLIVAAMALRAPYPAIKHNLRLVEDAQRKLEVETRRQPLPPLKLCARALPILVDLALRSENAGGRAKHRAGTGSRPSGTVHLIQATAGTAVDPGWLVRRLASMLGHLDLEIWATDEVAGGPGKPSRTIDPILGLFPRGGCHIHVGVDLDVTEWMRRTEAERVVVICAPRSPAELLSRLRAIACDGARPVDLVFPSRAMACRFGEGHGILPPPVELRDNPPALVRDTDSAAARLVGLTVGMIGRNWEGDPPGDEEAQFLKRVAAAAGSLELYDAGRWRYSLGGEASIRFCSRQDAQLEQFLELLDCFLVCPAPWWLEEGGRAIFSSMASGVPAIVPMGSIFAEYIDHGVDGLLYESFDDAVRQLADLRRAPLRIVGLRHGARAKIARLADPAALRSTVRQIAFGRSIEPDAQRPEPPQRTAATSPSPMRRTP